MTMNVPTQQSFQRFDTIPVIPTQPVIPRGALSSGNQPGPRPSGNWIDSRQLGPAVVRRNVYGPARVPGNHQLHSILPTAPGGGELSLQQNQHAVTQAVQHPYGQPWERREMFSTPPVVPGDGRSRLHHNLPRISQTIPHPFGRTTGEEVARSGVQTFNTRQPSQETGLSSHTEEQQRRTALALAAT